MDKTARPEEILIEIKPADPLADASCPIPADLFNKMFNTVLGALKAAERSIRLEKKSRANSEFYVSHLRMGSNEFGIVGRDSTVSLLEQCANTVYRSEYGLAAQYPKIARKLMELGGRVNPKYAMVARFHKSEIPIDAFFASQVNRLTQEIASEPRLTPFFIGSAISSFDGRLSNIDYRGSIWRGHLMLPVSEIQIECIFDRRLGEDAYNPFGNKRVNITGRAIYTGDSPLPERIEVVTINPIPAADVAVDIRGSLVNTGYGIADRGVESLQ
jgi:hypothetical protein